MVQYSGQLDCVFSALSDATRRSIISQLSTRSMTVSELAAPYAMSLPAVAKHVHILESAGLLRSRKIGRERHCVLAAAAMSDAADWIADYRAFWEKRLDALDQFLSNHEDNSAHE